MSYHGDIALGSTIDVKFTTRRFSTGAPYTLAGTPAVSAYVDNGTTEITAGITLTVDFDSRTGLNNVRVVATSGNGYSAGTNVQLVITAGTVDSVSVVGEVVASFSIEARSALRPTTAGRTLAVDASGNAAAQLANGVEHGGASANLYMGGTNSFGATTYNGALTLAAGAVINAGASAGVSVSTDSLPGVLIETANDNPVEITRSGTGTAAVAVTGGYSISGALSAGTNSLPWASAWDAEVQSECDDALAARGITSTRSGYLDNLSGGAVALEATAQSILTDTAVIGAAGAGLSAIPWNASWDAEVQSEVEDALITFNLDHLVGTATGIPSVPAGTYLDQIMDDGTASYDRTTDSLQAVRDRGDAAWTTATGFSTHSAADVWAAGTRTLTAIDEDSTTLDLDATVRAAVGMASADLDAQIAALPTAAENADAVWEEAIADHSGTSGSTAEALNAAGSAGDPWTTSLPGSYSGSQAGKMLADVLTDTGTDGVVVAAASKTGYTLSSAGVAAIWDALTSGMSTAGSIGKRIVDYLTGDVFARLGAPAGASVSADIAAAKTQLDAIEADTQDMQGRLPAALTAGGHMKADMLATNGDTTSAASLAKTTRAIARGTVTAGGTTTSIPTSAFAPSGAVADQFKGRIVTFDADTTTAALRGQSTDITASSNSATPTLTVTALTTVPASGDTFSVT